LTQELIKYQFNHVASKADAWFCHDAVLSQDVCPSVCHTPVLSRNG